MNIYSYVLRTDDGAAPNPFGGICTLTICKPVIRRTACIGDWVIGTGSKRVNLGNGETCDFSDSIVYAMKITDIMSLKEYDEYCKASLTNKIPVIETKDWTLKVGDCIYDYSKGDIPLIRRGVHNENNRARDLSGHNALLSDHFYYFGSEARPLPLELKDLIKKSQGHKKIENVELLRKFEMWIEQFDRNRIYADPQMCWFFDREITDKNLSDCANQCSEDDNEMEEEVC
ncbi:MAG: hypothetical protein ACK5LF_01485 [Bacteroides xylanisolvens]